MEFIDFIALTIVALVIFMFIYRFFIKKQHKSIGFVDTNPVSARSPQCIENVYSTTKTEKTKDSKTGFITESVNTVPWHECIATYSIDIQLNDFTNTSEEKHILSICDNKGITFHNGTKCSFENLDIEKLQKNRLTLTFDKNINHLIIRSENLKQKETIEYIPLQEWVNITVVLDHDRMEVYINGKLTNTYLLSKSVVGGPLYMYTTQKGGFDGYIKNVKYIPEALQSRDINSMIGKTEGIAGSLYDSMNNMINTIVELPKKYLYNYDSCGV